MSIYYIVANNKHINTEYLKTNVTKDDYIVHFNKQNHFNSLKNLPAKHCLFMNDCDNLLFGYDIFAKKKQKFETLFLRKSCKDKKYYNQLKFFDNDVVFIETPRYNSNKSPSAGYTLISYLINNNVEYHNIKLIGFSFSGWNGHDWDYEISFCNNHFDLIL